MASTFSPNLRLELIGTGEQQGTWGATTNVNLGTLIEEAIGGYTSVTVSNSGDTTLTTNNGSADQARNMVLNLTGTISAARNVIVPAIEKLYVVKNATTGGFAVTVKVSGQTGVSVPNGSTLFLYVDGTDVRAITGSAAAQSIGTSGATVPLLNGVNVWSGVQTFGTGSGDAFVNINGGAASTRGVVTASNGSARWLYGVDNSAESGSNVGSSFFFNRHDDSGTYIDTPLSISRATGVTALQSLSLNTDLAVTHGGTGASDASGARTNLGLGTAATQNTGTSGANVPLLNGTNTWSGQQTFSGGISSSFLIKASTGVEGGELILERPPTTTLTGDVIVDVFNNTGGGGSDVFRFYENAGSFKGAYLDLTNLASSVGSKILTTSDIGTSGAKVPLLNAANTFSADQTFGDGSGAVNFTINGATASTRLISVETAGSDRWAFGVNAVSETGSNAGSNFVVRRFDDTGTLQGTPVSINRATGVTTIDALDATGTPTATNTAGYTNTNQIATTAQVYATVTRTPINYQTGTTYTIQLSDAGKLLMMDNAGAITLTIPTNATAAIALDTRIDLVQWGVGQVTVAAAVGVTLASAGSRVKTGERYAGATLVKVNTDSWLLMGNIA